MMLALLITYHLLVDSPGLPPAPLDPRVVASPGGACELVVDPGDLDGAGAARYELVRDGAVVWAGERPVTLLAACVGETGVVVGFASTEGQLLRGEHHLIVLDARGRVALDEVLGRSIGRTQIGAVPRAVALDEGADRFLVEVADDTGLRARIHRLSSGERLGDVPLQADPAEWARAGATERLVAAERIRLETRGGGRVPRPAGASAGGRPPGLELAVVAEVALETAPARRASGRILAWAPLGADMVQVAREVPEAVRAQPRVAIETFALGGGRSADAPSAASVVALPFHRDSDVALAHVRDRRWLAAGASAATPDATVIAAIDGDADVATAIAELPVSGLALAARADGAFAVLASPTDPVRIEAYDPAGRRLWTRAFEESEDPADEPRIELAVDLRWTDDGGLAVLDFDDALLLLDREGRARRVVDLSGFASDEPHLGGLAPGGRGEVLVHGVARGVLRVGLDGAVERFDPPALAGRADAAALTRSLRIAPDGAVWTTDGWALYSLDSRGTLALRAGAPSTFDAVAEPELATIARDGRIFCLDAATRRVHAWEPDGRRLWISEPLAPARRWPGLGPIVVADDGAVLVGRGPSKAYARVHPDHADPSDVYAPDAYGHADGWGFGFRGGLLRVDAPDADGATRIDRLPPEPGARTRGRWVDEVAGVATFEDGAIAVVARGVLALYDERGAPLASVELGAESYSAHLSTGGDRVLIDAGGAGRFLADREDLRPVRLDLPAALDRVVLSPDGSEAWGFDARALALVRYALP